MKKLLALLLAFTLVLGGSAFSFAAESTSVVTAMDKGQFKYTMKEFEALLPFKLSPADAETIEKTFIEINYAFMLGKLDKAEILLKGYYSVIKKYWMAENTLKVLLPFEDMMTFGGKLMTPEDKEAIEKKFASLAKLRKDGQMEDYFKVIKSIHTDYYKLIGDAVGDTQNELQLLQYIKGADKLTPSDLVNYTYEDYLYILPFTLKDKDFVKGEKIFKAIIVKLKANDMDAAKKLTKDLHGFMAPYWISDEALKTIVPHEKYTKQAIKFFTRKNQLDLNTVYKAIVKAQKTADFDAYFKAIDKYYKTFGESIQEFYDDYFDEVVFIRS